VRLKMAQINIVTTSEEQEIVLKAIATLSGQTVAVSDIAKKAGLNQNRVRYVITDLEEAGKIKRIPTKAFNKHYIRYSYEVLV
jgi:DNA-binding MarR family transcriptional regulator